MIKEETTEQRTIRILSLLETAYPGKKAYDLDHNGLHFYCELEQTKDHPEYDRVIEVIISSKPHKHLIMTQYYSILKGNLELHINNSTITLKTGDKFTIEPNTIH